MNYELSYHKTRLGQENIHKYFIDFRQINVIKQIHSTITSVNVRPKKKN